MTAHIVHYKDLGGCDREASLWSLGPKPGSHWAIPLHLERRQANMVLLKRIARTGKWEPIEP